MARLPQHSRYVACRLKGLRVQPLAP